MNEERLYTILKSPHVSEKTMQSENLSQYAFKVEKNANKLDVKTAVEKIFDVRVRKIRMVNMKGKRTLFKKVRGKKSSWKKAYVFLEKGQVIELGTT